MSLVFYRKHRPQTFAEIIGQEHIVKTLTNSIALSRIGHAYLFGGPRGVGKTTLARIFAKAVNCQNRKEGQSEPCNQCSSCKEIMEGRSMDLIEIDAASHRGIDEIRELRDSIQFVPTKSKYRVFILDEAHQLSKDAANALLKTLEEPPPFAIFILATTEAHKMIPTILSRCQRFDFRKLTVTEILKRLEFICQKENIKIVDSLSQNISNLAKEKGFTIERPVLKLIALNSGGALRDAESLLDQVLNFASALGNKKEIKTEDIKELLGLVEIETISQFVDFLCQKNAPLAIKFLNDLIEKGFDLQEFTKTLLNYLRQALILKIAGLQIANPFFEGLTKEELQKLKEQTESFKEEELRNILNLFLEAQNKMKYSPIPQLPLELAIVEALKIKGK